MALLVRLFSGRRLDVGLRRRVVRRLGPVGGFGRDRRRRVLNANRRTRLSLDVHLQSTSLGTRRRRDHPGATRLVAAGTC